MGNSFNMGKQIKGGYLLRYKRGWLWRSWREEWVVLYEDSTLAWFKDKGTRSPRGRLLVNEAPELVAVSEWTLQVPQRPRLPPDCQVGQLIALGSKRHRGKVHWLLAQSEDEVKDWMTAISNTLPPPPHMTIETDKNQSVAIIHNGSLRNTYVRPLRIVPNGSCTPHQVSCGGGGSSVCSGGDESDRRREEDYASGTAAAGLALNWGRGWGWAQALWGTGGVSGASMHGVVYGAGAGAASVYATEMSANPYAHVALAADDYVTSTAFDDVDYSMDISGDFGF